MKWKKKIIPSRITNLTKLIPAGCTLRRNTCFWHIELLTSMQIQYKPLFLQNQFMYVRDTNECKVRNTKPKVDLLGHSAMRSLGVKYVMLRQKGGMEAVSA